jgi:hypothetical protein
MLLENRLPKNNIPFFFFQILSLPKLWCDEIHFNPCSNRILTQLNLKLKTYNCSGRNIILIKEFNSLRINTVQSSKATNEGNLVQNIPQPVELFLFPQDSWLLNIEELNASPQVGDSRYLTFGKALQYGDHICELQW